MIASYRPKHVLRLVRNPYFHEWSKAAQPDGYPDVITVAIGGTPNKAVADVIQGKADMFSSSQFASAASPDRLAAIATRQASQVHTNPQPATVGLFLNTRVAPFNRLDVRRAVNYAADRAAAVQVDGGPDFDQPTCQILPPNFQGYRPYCPYTAGRPTRRNVDGAGSREGAGVDRPLGHARHENHLLGRLRRLRLLRRQAPSVTGLPSLSEGAPLERRGNRLLLRRWRLARESANRARSAWTADYPAASDFFSGQFTCASFLPNSPVNQNASEFCDPRVDRQIKQALAAQASEPRRRPRTVGTRRQTDRRPGAMGAARQSEAVRRSRKARRQLPVQPRRHGHADRPALGPLTRAPARGRRRRPTQSASAALAITVGCATQQPPATTESHASCCMRQSLSPRSKTLRGSSQSRALFRQVSTSSLTTSTAPLYEERSSYGSLKSTTRPVPRAASRSH